jgi:nicotinamide-nucleotide amidase
MNEAALIARLAAELGAALQAQRAALATAESCTGGGIGYAVTQVAGSSAWFERGFITYSNEAKEQLLDVPSALIARHGAVSEAVARAMALGALARSRAQSRSPSPALPDPVAVRAPSRWAPCASALRARHATTRRR